MVQPSSALMTLYSWARPLAKSFTQCAPRRQGFNDAGHKCF
jgi:hypothetical protein